jgi:hypothetical protein
MDIEALQGIVPDGAHMEWDVLPKGFSPSKDNSVLSTLVAKCRKIFSNS